MTHSRRHLVAISSQRVNKGHIMRKPIMPAYSQRLVRILKFWMTEVNYDFQIENKKNTIR